MRTVAEGGGPERLHLQHQRQQPIRLRPRVLRSGRTSPPVGNSISASVTRGAAAIDSRMLTVYVQKEFGKGLHGAPVGGFLFKYQLPPTSWGRPAALKTALLYATSFCSPEARPGKWLSRLLYTGLRAVQSGALGERVQAREVWSLQRQLLLPADPCFGSGLPLPQVGAARSPSSKVSATHCKRGRERSVAGRSVTAHPTARAATRAAAQTVHHCG